MNKFISSGIEYQVLEFLGEGGSSEVYRVQRQLPDMDVDQELALKILKSETLVDLWRKEFQEFQGLQSPHLLNIIGFDKVDGRPALLLEYVRGVSLTQLKKQKNIKFDVQNEILRQIRAGLDDLHKLDKCHGDLSPNNILIDESGRVVLTDFLGAQSGFVTAEFSSPQVCDGGTPNKETDLYSFYRIALWLGGTNVSSQSIDFNQKARSELSLMIKELLKHKESNDFYTRPVSHENSYKIRSFMIKPMQCLLILLSLPLLVGSTASSVHRTDYQLEIVTENWVELQINGQKMGYAPISIVSATPQIKIEWRNQNASGELSLVLRPGEYRRLHDAELFDKANQGAEHEQ